MRLIDADVLKPKILEYVKALERIKYCYGYDTFGKYYNGKKSAYLNVADLIDEAPTVEERKQGYWLKKHHVSDASEFTAICCSSCGYKVDFFWNDWQNSKYCPNCGAKMDGE